MTDAERWKVINAVPADDLMAAMKALGDMLKAGATAEEVQAMKKAMVMAWALLKELSGLNDVIAVWDWFGDMRERRRFAREKREALAREEQAREDVINPRCVCWHRINKHGREKGCMGTNMHPHSMYHSVPCQCMRFIQRAAPEAPNGS